MTEGSGWGSDLVGGGGRICVCVCVYFSGEGGGEGSMFRCYLIASKRLTCTQSSAMFAFDKCKM